MKIKSACMLLSAIISGSNLMAFNQVVCEKYPNIHNHVKVTFERLPGSEDYRITHTDTTDKPGTPLVEKVTQVISRLQKFKRSEKKRTLSCSDYERKTSGYIKRTHPNGGYMFAVTEGAHTVRARTKIEFFSQLECSFDKGI